MRSLILAVLLACGGSAAAGGLKPLVRRGDLLLSVDGEGRGQLRHREHGPLRCGPLHGAWGLWVDDVDDDGHREVLVALRKRARFDPVVENRLHVYTIRGAACVPLWRGTRLAGRFERLGGVRGGKLLALERIGRGRRWLARYRWTGFGYAVQRVLWRGKGPLPRRLVRLLSSK